MSRDVWRDLLEASQCNLRVSSEGQRFSNLPFPLPHIPWEKVHTWYSVTETRKLILASIVRVTAWSLATLKNKARSPILNRPIKEASNCTKKIKNLYSMWPHCQEGQRDIMPSPSSPAQSFQAFGMRFSFSTWPELFVGPGRGEVLSITVWV